MMLKQEFASMGSLWVETGLTIKRRYRHIHNGQVDTFKTSVEKDMGVMIHDSLKPSSVYNSC